MGAQFFAFLKDQPKHHHLIHQLGPSQPRRLDVRVHFGARLALVFDFAARSSMCRCLSSLSISCEVKC